MYSIQNIHITVQPSHSEDTNTKKTLKLLTGCYQLHGVCRDPIMLNDRQLPFLLYCVAGRRMTDIFPSMSVTGTSMSTTTSTSTGGAANTAGPTTLTLECPAPRAPSPAHTHPSPPSPMLPSHHQHCPSAPPPHLTSQEDIMTLSTSHHNCRKLLLLPRRLVSTFLSYIK